MKRGIVILSLIGLLWQSEAGPHFGMIIPSDDIISPEDSRKITLEVKFAHPMEDQLMEMEKPLKFEVMHGGRKINLLKNLQRKKIKGFSTWRAIYEIKKPGDYIFYVEPKPYWEPAEDCYIIHYTKVCINALGLEEGWDDEVGLPIEIIPLTRPYGLWTGNIFTGIVKKGGKPLPFATIEVEYYNKDLKVKPPADPYITQVIKADKNGVFSYAMPKAGWWGFAALSTASYKLKGPDGKKKAVEIGGVFWVRVRDMR